MMPATSRATRKLSVQRYPQHHAGRMRLTEYRAYALVP